MILILLVIICGCGILWLGSYAIVRGKRITVQEKASLHVTPQRGIRQLSSTSGAAQSLVNQIPLPLELQLEYIDTYPQVMEGVRPETGWANVANRTLTVGAGQTVALPYFVVAMGGRVSCSSTNDVKLYVPQRLCSKTIMEKSDVEAESLYTQYKGNRVTFQQLASFLLTRRRTARWVIQADPRGHIVANLLV